MTPRRNTRGRDTAAAVWYIYIRMMWDMGCGRRGDVLPALNSSTAAAASSLSQSWVFVCRGFLLRGEKRKKKKGEKYLKKKQTKRAPFQEFERRT